MGIKIEELLQGVKLESIPAEHQANLLKLLVKAQKFREAYGKPITVTNSYRTMEHHLEIYKNKGITDKSKIPMKSKHLSGDAFDFADPNGDLKKFVLANPKLMEELDLYFEAFESTPNWVHGQQTPFGSYKRGGTRFFKP